MVQFIPCPILLCICNVCINCIAYFIVSVNFTVIFCNFILNFCDRLFKNYIFRIPKRFICRKFFQWKPKFSFKNLNGNNCILKGMFKPLFLYLFYTCNYLFKIIFFLSCNCLQLINSMIPSESRRKYFWVWQSTILQVNLIIWLAAIFGFNFYFLFCLWYWYGFWNCY